MTTTLTPRMHWPITDITGAKAFCDDLIAHDLVFHFEDSPDTIVKGIAGERLFDDAQAKIMAKRVRELYALEWGAHECPIGYVLDQTGGTGWRTRA
jgi:hypothetical protein